MKTPIKYLCNLVGMAFDYSMSLVQNLTLLGDMSISDFIKKKRLGAFLTQQEASQLLGYKKSQFLSNLERGTRRPPIETLKKMCKIYKISPEEMREEYIKDAQTAAKETAESKWDGISNDSKKSNDQENGN